MSIWGIVVGLPFKLALYFGIKFFVYFIFYRPKMHPSHRAYLITDFVIDNFRYCVAFVAAGFFISLLDGTVEYVGIGLLFVIVNFGASLRFRRVLIEKGNFSKRDEQTCQAWAFGLILFPLSVELFI